MKGTNCMNFYDAYHFLRNHRIFNNRFEKGLDIMVVKVDPETNCIENDSKKNTKVRIWLETGPYLLDEPHGCERCHDLDLDCGGDTFEEAIIKLADKVKKQIRLIF